jgi:hypothetical protein
MALDLEITALDSVPEAVRALYVPHGDKFRLDVQGIEDTSGLKSALEKERTTARELDKQTKQWKSLGKTPDEISALIAAQAQAESDKLAKAGEWDKLRAQMNEKHAQDIAVVTDKVAAKDKALAKYLVDSAAVSAIAAAKGAHELLLPHVRNAVKVIEENGDYTVRVVDAAGNPRVDGKGAYLSITDLVSEMRQSPVYGRAFESSGATGGGASQSASGANGKRSITRAQFDAMDAAGQIAAATDASKGLAVITD